MQPCFPVFLSPFSRRKEPSCSYPKLSASDVILKAEELRNTKETLEEVLSRLTGKPLVLTWEMLRGGEASKWDLDITEFVWNSFPVFFWGESEKFFIAFFCVSPEADIVDAVARDRYISVHEAGWPHFSVVNPIAEIELAKKHITDNDIVVLKW